MKHSSKTILVCPTDPSIIFLLPIIECIKKLYGNLELSDGKFIEVNDDVELIIFLGHGSSSVLYGNLNDKGEKIDLFSIDYASRLFSDISVILLSCRSCDFIVNVKRNVQLELYVGFGDMPTDWNDIESVREDQKEYLLGFGDEHLDFYKQSLVEAVIYGFQSIKDSCPSRMFFLGIKTVINKRINQILLNLEWTKEIKIQLVDLHVKLKSEISYG